MNLARQSARETRCPNMQIPPDETHSERIGRGAFSAETLNTIVQTIAIIGAGVWAIYTFVYQAKIVPNRAPPSLSVSSTLEKAGIKGHQIAVRSTVTRSNVGQTGVRLLGLTYNAIGVKVRFPSAAAANAGAGFEQDISRSSTVSAARYYDDRQQREVILRYGVLFEGATVLPTSPSALNPGETVSREMIIYADRSRFDAIRFQVRLWYSKESDPPIPLVFEVDDQGQLSAELAPSCMEEHDNCQGMKTTDFATEFSLW